MAVDAIRLVRRTCIISVSQNKISKLDVFNCQAKQDVSGVKSCFDPSISDLRYVKQSS